MGFLGETGDMGAMVYNHSHLHHQVGLALCLFVGP